VTAAEGRGSKTRRASAKTSCGFGDFGSALFSLFRYSSQVAALHADMDDRDRTSLVQRFTQTKNPSLLIMSHIISAEGLSLEVVLEIGTVSLQGRKRNGLGSEM